MIVVYFFLWRYTNVQQSVWGHVRVHIYNRPIKDEPTKSLVIKTEYTPRAVARLVNICNCHTIKKKIQKHLI